MKLVNVSKGLLLGLLLLLATGGLAASDTNKGSLATSSGFIVNGTNVPPGEYSLKWEGTGSNVQLNILKGKKVVATTPARLIDLERSPSADAVVVKNNGDGSQSLAEVRFAGKKHALAIGEEATSEAGGASK